MTRRGRVVESTIHRSVILARAREHLARASQWAETRDWHRAASYESMARGLVELVEVDDCGSVGGYDHRRGSRQRPIAS